jgi:hypothetical protein
MKQIKPPQTPDFDGDVPHLVFMAGGITDCPDWQAYYYDLVKHRIPDDFVLINPRRDNFDVRDPSMSDEQIKWEYKWLQRASIVSFWFPQETLCPITLFELGKELGLQCGPHPRKKIVLGMHPDYKRRVDVETQTALVDPNIEISYTLEDLSAQLILECHRAMV